MSYRPSLRGRRLAVRTAMEHPIGALPRTPFPASRDFPSRGNEKIGGTGYCVTYDTDSQSRNVLASPLGEEGHEVAKGVQANWIHRGAPRPANPVRRHPAKSVCTRVRMIMILDVDVTAERRHYNTHRPAGDNTTLGPKGRRPLSEANTTCRRQAAITLGTKSRQPSHRRCVQGRYHRPRPGGPSTFFSELLYFFPET